MRGLSPNWLLGTETLHLYIRRRLEKNRKYAITAMDNGISKELLRKKD